MDDERYDYIRVELKEGDDRHVIASGYEIQGWMFVAYAHSPSALIFCKLKEVVEA